jgi:hypothetical protein
LAAVKPDELTSAPALFEHVAVVLATEHAVKDNEVPAITIADRIIVRHRELRWRTVAFLRVTPPWTDVATPLIDPTPTFGALETPALQSRLAQYVNLARHLEEWPAGWIDPPSNLH